MKNRKLEIFAYIILCIVFAFAIVLMAISWVNSQASNLPEEATITENITTDVETTAPEPQPRFCYFEFVSEIGLTTRKGLMLVEELSPTYEVIYHIYEVKGRFEDDDSYFEDEIYFIEYATAPLPMYEVTPRLQVSIFNYTQKKDIVKNFINHTKPFLDTRSPAYDYCYCYWHNGIMDICGVHYDKTLSNSVYYLFAVKYDVNETVHDAIYFTIYISGLGEKPIEEQPLQPVS